MFNFKKKDNKPVEYAKTILVIDVRSIPTTIGIHAAMKTLNNSGVLLIDPTNGGTAPYNLTLPTNFKIDY